MPDLMKKQREDIAKKAIAKIDLRDIKTKEGLEKWAASQKGSPPNPFKDWLQMAREFNPAPFRTPEAKEVVPDAILYGKPEK